MKILVACYSRTGTTKEVGEAIAKELGADFDEIVDLKKRTGLPPIRFLIAGKDATRKRKTNIKFERAAAGYDLIVIGTPVWAGNITPAVRTYLGAQRLDGKKVAFFCTYSIGHEKVFDEMKALVPKSVVVGTLGIPAKEVKAGDYLKRAKEFAESLKK
ncbi:MAG: flavodoxin family protein [Candidatus Hadarchaeum sp.]|uniref:flavodoxin family protein n=1 Tax=Candidatus Hadarchaeum sp. TaxID=2883567 RepID=UPI003D12F9FD